VVNALQKEEKKPGSEWKTFDLGVLNIRKQTPEPMGEGEGSFPEEVATLARLRPFRTKNMKRPSR
jgi:hypothetical protein